MSKSLLIATDGNQVTCLIRALTDLFYICHVMACPALHWISGYSKSHDHLKGISFLSPSGAAINGKSDIQLFFGLGCETRKTGTLHYEKKMEMLEI